MKITKKPSTGGASAHVIIDSGTITGALPAGTNVIGHVIADTGSTTAVTGSVAVTNANLDVALSTRTRPADQQHAIIDSGTVTTVSTVTSVTTLGTITNVVHVDDNAGSLTVDGTVALGAGSQVIGHVITDATSVTNATLSAETTKVIGTVNVASGQAIQANAGTNLNTSALALEAGHLATIDTSTAKIPAQGQALAAASMPVVLTAIQQAALTPPAAITGFALDATLTSSNTKLDTLHTDLAAQARLVDTQPVSVASLPLPTGAALDSSLTTVNTNLTTLDTDIKQLTTNAAPLPWFMAGQGTFFATGS